MSQGQMYIGELLDAAQQLALWPIMPPERPNSAQHACWNCSSCKRSEPQQLTQAVWVTASAPALFPRYSLLSLYVLCSRPTHPCCPVQVLSSLQVVLPPLRQVVLCGPRVQHPQVVQQQWQQHLQAVTMTPGLLMTLRATTLVVAQICPTSCPAMNRALQVGARSTLVPSA